VWIGQQLEDCIWIHVQFRHDNRLRARSESAIPVCTSGAQRWSGGCRGSQVTISDRVPATANVPPSGL